MDAEDFARRDAGLTGADGGLRAGETERRIERNFILLFVVMLTIAAGNTAMQSVLPALGRSLNVPDSAVAAAFSVSALLWVVSAPFWANRSDRHGRRPKPARQVARRIRTIRTATGRR